MSRESRLVLTIHDSRLTFPNSRFFMIEEIVQLKQKVTEVLQENYRLRQVLEADKTASEATFMSIINDFLATYDLVNPDEKVSIITTLSKYQVVRIPLATAKEDSEYVKIISRVKDTTKRDGVIVEFRKDGFAWKNRVIRQAEVIVVKN